MPGSTPNQNYPYPLDSEQQDTAQHLEDLARAIDGDIFDALATVSDKVARSGDTMTGMLSLPGFTPTSLNHATRKGYVDDQDELRVATSGDAMTGQLDMTGNKITNVATPTGTADAVPKSYVDTSLANVVRIDTTSTQIMAGRLRAPTFTVTDPTPDNPDELTSKQYVDDQDAETADAINHVLLVNFDDHQQTFEAQLFSGVSIVTTNGFASIVQGFPVAFLYTPQFFAISAEATQALVLGVSNSATSVTQGTVHAKNYAGAPAADTVVQYNWFACGISAS